MPPDAVAAPERTYDLSLDAEDAELLAMVILAGRVKRQRSQRVIGFAHKVLARCRQPVATQRVARVVRPRRRSVRSGPQKARAPDEPSPREPDLTRSPGGAR